MGKALLAILLLFQATDDKAAVDEAIKKFNKAFANPNASARALAVTELGSTKHDKTLNKIVPLLSADVTAVRKSAAEALAGFEDWKKTVTPALMNGLTTNAKDPAVCDAIFKALGKMADPASLQTVHGYFRDPSVVTTKGAIACVGSMRQKESMDALIELQKDIQKWLKNNQSGPYRDDKGQKGDDNAAKGRLEDIQKAIVKAFQDITTEKWTVPKEWEIWWEKHKATFEIPKK